MQGSWTSGVACYRRPRRGARRKGGPNEAESPRSAPASGPAVEPLPRLQDHPEARREARCALLVGGVEAAPAAGIEELRHAEDPPLMVAHRQRQDRAGAEAGPLVDLPVETGIGVGVVHALRLPA